MKTVKESPIFYDTSNISNICLYTLGTCHLLEGGRAGANGGRVIKCYVAKKGRVTKNLSWALGRAIPFLANIAVHLK